MKSFLTTTAAKEIYIYMDTKPITCICKQCECAYRCEYYAEVIKPVIEAVEVTLCDTSEPFIRKLDEALESFTCDVMNKEI